MKLEVKDYVSNHVYTVEDGKYFLDGVETTEQAITEAMQPLLAVQQEHLRKTIADSRLAFEPRTVQPKDAPIGELNFYVTSNGNLS